MPDGSLFNKGFPAMQSHGKDLKGQTLAFFAGVASAAITAAATGDNTQIVGDTIDLTALDARPSSVVFDIPVRATLAEDKTCIVTGLIEKSADGATWATLLASTTLLTLTGDTGGSTEKGVARLGADLIESDCNYIRFKATPDLNASGTDTMTIGGVVATFGGLQKT
jgi:hypothetical protein